MRKLNGFIILGILAMIISPANAQMTITIDNQVIPTEHISSIVILPNTNEINVSTTVTYQVAPVVVGDGVVINSFTASSYSVTEGQSVTFSWDTSNAVSCEATNGVDGWAGSVIALPSGNKSITTATTGSYTFSLTCDGSATDDTTSRSVVVNISPVDAVSISSFNVVPSTIATGESTTVSWSTVNAVSCTPTGGTADWTSTSISLPSGSTSINIDAAGSYTFSLTCQGSGGDQDTQAKVVQVTDPNQSCDGVTLSGNTIGWQSFWSAAFPGPVYENVTNWIIPQSGYLAIEFNTGNIIDDGKITSLENASSPGLRLGSFSQCPGDFNVPAECMYTWGLGGGLRWATNDKLGACDLEPNKTYYFNITFTDGADPSSTSCNAAPCRINLQHVNF